MDTLTSASLGARRNEDIALDLLKFVAVTAGVGRPAAPSTGFSGAAVPKPEEHVNQLLELYSRCLKAVEGKGQRKRQRNSRRTHLRVAVAGAGAFGRNHLRVYRELETAGQGVALVAAVEPDAARAAEAAAQVRDSRLRDGGRTAGCRSASRCGQRCRAHGACIMRWPRRCWMRASTCWSKSRWPRASPRPTT